MTIERASIMARIRSLQKAIDELAGMLAALPDDTAIAEDLTPPLMPLKKVDSSDSDLMSARQVQSYLGIGESTFYTWIREGRLPQGQQWGGKMKRWSRAGLEAWRRGHRTEVTKIDL